MVVFEQIISLKQFHCLGGRRSFVQQMERLDDALAYKISIEIATISDN